MEAWHMFEAGHSGDSVINDYSGNDRHVNATGLNPPVLTSDLVYGQPGWYFNGSTTDPLYYTGSVTWKHLFILASAEGTTFNQNRGLVSGPTSGDALTSNNSGDTFFNFGFGSDYQYRKSGVAFAESNQKAPMSATHQILELRRTAGVTMDGIQIGKQRNLAGRIWKGWFFEDLMYSVEKTDLEVFNVYRYFAMRYQVWQIDATTGLYVFPFAADRTLDSETDKENYLSEPYDGDAKALTRGSFKGRYSLPFSTREQEEFDAARAFHAQHYPLGEFVYRDYAFYPYKEVRVRFASPFRRHGSNVTFRFNYSFDIVEVD
jgi:hypothetical protein